MVQNQMAPTYATFPAGASLEEYQQAMASQAGPHAAGLAAIQVHTQLHAGASLHHYTLECIQALIYFDRTY